MVPIIGIDNGRTGAMVYLDSPTTAGAGIHWTACTRKKRRAYKVQSAILHPNRERVVMAREGLVWTGHEIGTFALEIFKPLVALSGGRFLLGAEDVYIPGPKQSGSVRSSVVLARFAGSIAGPLEPWALSGEAEWLKAATWRKEILGLSHFAKRELAKRESLGQLPRRIRGLAVLEENLRFQDAPCNDITDAAGVAAYVALHA